MTRFRRGWVGLIDILGFGDRIAQAPEEMLALYQEAVGQTLKKFGQTNSEIASIAHEAVVFSDSIFILPSEENNSLVHQFGATCWYARQVADIFWAKGIPTRGAVSFGSFYYDARRSICLGDAIVSAHRWEQAQEWMWFSISPESYRKVCQVEIEPNPFAPIFYDLEVPTKQGTVFTKTMMPNATNHAAVAATVNKNMAASLASGYSGQAQKWCNTASFFSAFNSEIKPGPFRPRRKSQAGFTLE